MNFDGEHQTSLFAIRTARQRALAGFKGAGVVPQLGQLLQRPTDHAHRDFVCPLQILEYEQDGMVCTLATRAASAVAATVGLPDPRIQPLHRQIGEPIIGMAMCQIGNNAGMAELGA